MKHLKKIWSKIRNYYHIVESNIAFYPAVFGLAGLLVALFMKFIEQLGASTFLLKLNPALVINNYNTATTLLSFLSGGIISIMVFSFSMVMLLLQEAASNFSPRVLPGLISVKRHQYILGLYLGSIIYNTFTLVGLKPNGDNFQLPGFSILIGILFTIICFFFFIYFINSISISIQVTSILSSIYDKAEVSISKLIEIEELNQYDFPKDNEWQTYYSQESNYFQNIDHDALMDICIENNLKISVIPFKGSFVLKRTPLFKCEQELNEDLLKTVINCFIFYKGEIVEENHLFGFKEITEIGVRAMSPGINDPGTAINTIDYITKLFSLRMKKRDETYYGKDGVAYIKMNTVDFKELLYRVMLPYRTYCKHDATCVQKLFLMLNHLSYQINDFSPYKVAINNEIENLLADAKSAIKNPRDFEKIEDLAKNTIIDFEEEDDDDNDDGKEVK